MTPSLVRSGSPSRLAVALLRALLRAYQLAVSPLIGPSCRFAPTCSEYAREALAAHGALRGLGLAARRVARCHPFHAGGYDPVPGAPTRSAGHRPERDDVAAAPVATGRAG